jgi:hypothetical protein
LADLRIAGTGKRTLSMDYNFYYSHSGANADLDPVHDELYKKEMLDTYMGYFETNYYGNRAPIHIGHHFAKWNSGAYWLALQEFSKTVCIKPEVRCVGYNDLAKFMNSLPPEIIKSYKKGEFKKLPLPPSKISHIASVAPLDVFMTMKKISPDILEVKIEGSQASLLPQKKHSSFVWKIDNKEIFRTKSPQIKFASLLPYMGAANQISASYEHSGREILKTTHQLVFSFEGNPGILEEDLEKRSTLGDLPEAHKN